MRYLRLIVAVAALGLVGGCESWFGKKKEEALPGTRVSVLAHQTALRPDLQGSLEPIDLPPPENNPAWPQDGGSVDRPLYHVRLGSALQPVWSVSIGEGVASNRPRLPAPVVADGRVFTMDSEQRVRAFDAGSGKTLWDVDLTRKQDDDALSGGLAFANGALFATTGFAKVFALNASSGKEIWSRSVGAPIHGAPSVVRGRLVAITVNNVLYGINAADGRDLWPPHPALSEAAGLLGTASAAITEESIIAPFSSGDLVALRASTGRVMWSESLAPGRRTDELASVSHIRGRPAVDRGQVIAGSYGGILVAMNAATGDRLWERDIGSLNGAWLAGEYAFLVTSQQELVCLTRDKGTIRWVVKLPVYANEKEQKDPIVWAGPVLASNRLIVIGSGGKALMLSPSDGREVGSLKLSAGAGHIPVIADGRLYVVSDDGKLTAYQ
ncbi:MAG: PQQ-binding-like beta-propeller repeat protein [Defluviicoccus sp.]